MRRPVPEPSGTVAGALDLVGLGCAPADADALGRAATARGLAPLSACSARTTTAAIAPTVRPVTQTFGAGTARISSATDPRGGIPVVGIPVQRGSDHRTQSRTGSSSGRCPSDTAAARCRSWDTSPYSVVRGFAGRPAASATAIRSLTDLYEP